MLSKFTIGLVMGVSGILLGLIGVIIAGTVIILIERGSQKQ